MDATVRALFLSQWHVAYRIRHWLGTYRMEVCHSMLELQQKLQMKSTKLVQ